MLINYKKKINEGVSFGTAFVLNKKYSNIISEKIYKENINKEITNFLNLYKKTLLELNNLNYKFKKIFEENEENFIELSLKIFKKNNFIKNVIDLIKNQNLNKIISTLFILNKMLKRYELIENKYYIYIKYMGNLIIKNIFPELNFYLNYLNENTIAIIKDICLLNLIKFVLFNIKGIVIELDNFKITKNKFLNISKFLVAFDIKNITNIIKNGDYIIMDNKFNVLYINPCSKEIKNINMKLDII